MGKCMAWRAENRLVFFVLRLFAFPALQRPALVVGSHLALWLGGEVGTSLRVDKYVLLYTRLSCAVMP